ncbi:MAG: hypothetical protein GKS04_04670 [Candidatus Mycalebacterium zealandia]|nr:MAG: hypothetical protein GKS04_04670 [Candidatus Mycalebacterium zealandia]
MDNKNLFFDVRTVERNIAEGRISKSDFDKYLKEMKDSGENAEFETIGKDEDEENDSTEETE